MERFRRLSFAEAQYWLAQDSAISGLVLGPALSTVIV